MTFAVALSRSSVITTGVSMSDCQWGNNRWGTELGRSFSATGLVHASWRGKGVLMRTAVERTTWNR
jgi:hypothetical protein